MKVSKLFGKTIKQAREFDSVNATFLQKGGFVDQVMAGVYAYLPLGQRVLNKIENIVREEMDQIGQEIFMPTLAPKQIWEHNSRLDSIDILMTTKPANNASKEKNDAEYVVSPTHEDMVTTIAQKFNLSYRDFPFAVYQIQTKFRNEARPKSGLMRGREFRMKDLYSFHTSKESMEEYYQQAKEAYIRVYDRLGIGDDTYVTMASGGDFTKDYSHEFQTRTDTGEDLIFRVPSTGAAYNLEIAPAKAPAVSDQETEMAELQEVKGEGIIGVEPLAEFLGIPVEKTTKTILFETPAGEVIAAALRGGYEINEEKLVNIVGEDLKLASEETVKRVTGAEVGYAGLLNLAEEVRVFMDDSMQGRINFEMGANKTDYHSINVNFGRDLPEPEQFYDFKMAKEGDLFPETGEVYEVFSASEVGNIFPLGTKFAKAFDYKFTDENGEQQLVWMGSYGIGTSRVMGVIVEKYHDENGILWPKHIAPFQVYLIGIGEEGNSKAAELYSQFNEAGIEVLHDDRESSPGEKFKDADLLGIPVRIVVSAKTLEQGGVEMKLRSESDTTIVPLEEIAVKIVEFIRD